MSDYTAPAPAPAPAPATAPATAPAPGAATATPAALPGIALRADLLDFSATPTLGDPHSPGVRLRRDHWLLIGADGRIAAVQSSPPPPGWQRHDHRGRLILPGFIDSHVHSAQLPVIASWGAQLLDWLNTYTFPAEARHADAGHAQLQAQAFVAALLAHGSTAACAFPTVHKASCEALFDAALTVNMRMISGKVLMDRHAPSELCDTPASAERDSLSLIANWHGRGRCAYAITPRFAPTSSAAQLALAGELLHAHAGTYMQTHVAENADEVRWVAGLFPAARSYLDVYERFGLLNARAVLAHGIWLDDADRALLRQRGAHLAHCPSSNLFLGSGLFGWREAAAAQVAISLGSDVGGGTSLCLLRTLADAYRVQALAGLRLCAWDLLHAATRGAAQALQLGHEIGQLEPGLMADVCVWDVALGAVQQQRQAMANTEHERIFAWMMQADERHLVATWVAGRCQYQRAVSRSAAQAATRRAARQDKDAQHAAT